MRGSVIDDIDMRSLLTSSEGAAMPVADIMASEHVDPVGMVNPRGSCFLARPAVGE
jgi:hypothetical protein